ncbi:MAG: glycosyltransferase [Candidatus Aminicenantaceae bacterium]
MKEAGIEVLDCSYPKRNVFRYVIGFWKFLLYKNRCDIIFVGFFGHFIVPIVRLFTRKKIIFDAFLSMYQTVVVDRKVAKPQGIIAGISKFMDRLSCQLTDKVFLDTNQHIEYFVREYKIEKYKFYRLLLGSDNSVWYPRSGTEAEDFIIHFHGEFQPLHGVEYIIEAAKKLPDIKFQIIGKGKTLHSCRELAKRLNLNNINFYPQVRYEELPEYLLKASICLGIFGGTQKTRLVIPHKVYEVLAMGKPLITADTPAAREILVNGENAVLCRPADPQSLAESILMLKNDPILRTKIAQNGNKLFQDRCTPMIIGKQILKVASKIKAAQHFS